jgi:spermidine synthase
MIWQTVFGRCIYESPSGYKVKQNYFFRWLLINSKALQTVVYRRNVKQPILYYLPAFTVMARNKPDACCLLGLGGGSVVHMLTSAEYKITAVELSSEIINIAKDYFNLTASPHLQIIHQDAALFVSTSSARYRHLLIDLANDHRFPNECNQDIFFQYCKNLLVDNGYMVINLPYAREHFELCQRVRKHFKNTVVIPIKHCSNIVMICCNHGDRSDFIEDIQMYLKFKRLEFVADWGIIGHIK